MEQFGAVLRGSFRRKFQIQTGHKYQYVKITSDIYYLSLHFQKIKLPLQVAQDTLCLHLAVVNNLDIIIMRLRISYYWSKTKKNNIQHWGLNIGPNRNIGYSPNNEKQTKPTQNKTSHQGSRFLVANPTVENTRPCSLSHSPREGLKNSSSANQQTNPFIFTPPTHQWLSGL